MSNQCLSIIIFCHMKEYIYELIPLNKSLNTILTQSPRKGQKDDFYINDLSYYIKIEKSFID